MQSVIQNPEAQTPTPLYNQIQEWGWVEPLCFGSLDLGPANKSIWEGAKGSRQSLAKTSSHLSSICFQAMPEDNEDFAGWNQEDMVFLLLSLIFVLFLRITYNFNPSKKSCVGKDFCPEWQVS